MSVISEAKLAANRRNARKSTGPRTAAGKKRSSQNARKLGMFSRSLVRRDLASESSKAFQAFLKQLTDEFRPQTLLDRLWIERAACAMWRSRRAHRIEATAIAGEPGCILPSGNFLFGLVRYESMHDRNLDRALAALKKRN